MRGKSKGALLITGGAGFIGSHLCGRLLDEGRRVICVDNLATGSIDNIKGLAGRRGFTFIEDDIRQVELDSFDDVEGVYHLAAICGVPRVQKEPLRVILTVLESLLRILRWAAQKEATVLYVSSSEIYGKPLLHPQPESSWGCTNPVGPRSPYVEAKRAGEALCRAYRIEKGLSVRIARLFNVYGPGFRNDDPRVIPRFIQAAQAGEPLNVYGTGKATRSFCYVDDIVEGLMLLMDSELEQPVNLGFPQETEIKELAELTLRLTDSSSPIAYLPAIHEDPQRRLPDISLARRFLGWNPSITLKEGLRRTIRWFRRERRGLKPSSRSAPDA